ncbi:MAG: hypothetical protein ACLUMQ_02020 [Streptococcus salivarius]
MQQDEALRKIVVPAEYAKHDIKDYDWFIAHQDEFMKLQPEIDWDAYNQTALEQTKNQSTLNLTSAQRKEIAEFVSQMLNDLNQQYWSQREPGRPSPIQLTGGQEFADNIAQKYTEF